MVNGVNTSVKVANMLNRDVLAKQNENNEVKEKEQTQLSKAEQIKEQIKNGEEKMASNLLNL